MLWEGSRSGSDPSLSISLWSRGFESLHLRLLRSCWDPQGPSILWVVLQGLHLVWKGHLALRNFIWDPGRLRTHFVIFPKACVPGKHHWLQAIGAPSSSASRVKFEQKVVERTGKNYWVLHVLFCFAFLPSPCHNFPVKQPWKIFQ